MSLLIPNAARTGQCNRKDQHQGQSLLALSVCPGRLVGNSLRLKCCSDQSRAVTTHTGVFREVLNPREYNARFAKADGG
jgi:hypothetical protein